VALTRILVVDNYDSFVFNLVHYLQQLGAEVEVRRNDDVTMADIETFDGVLLSPGPGAPKDAGMCLQIIQATKTHRVPILGICLGHQAIGEVFGGSINQAPELIHGRTSTIKHDGKGVFASIPQDFSATRYHSLAIDDESQLQDLEVTARTADGTIMGVRHESLPIEGVQFHPESILTEHGHLLLANWLAACGLPSAVEVAKGLAPVQEQARV
jgi:para-aminobenzoate synthetase component 2